jgi:hypothetical protein
MSGNAKRKMTTIELMSIQQAAVDLLWHVVICYNSKCLTWLNQNLNNVYIRSWASSPLELISNGEYYCTRYLRFVSMRNKVFVLIWAQLTFLLRICDSQVYL